MKIMWVILAVGVVFGTFGLTKVDAQAPQAPKAVSVSAVAHPVPSASLVRLRMNLLCPNNRVKQFELDPNDKLIVRNFTDSGPGQLITSESVDCGYSNEGIRQYLIEAKKFNGLIPSQQKEPNLFEVKSIQLWDLELEANLLAEQKYKEITRYCNSTKSKQLALNQKPGQVATIEVRTPFDVGSCMSNLYQADATNLKELLYFLASSDTDRNISPNRIEIILKYKEVISRILDLCRLQATDEAVNAFIQKFPMLSKNPNQRLLPDPRR